MQLEAKEPAHWKFPSLSYALKHLVDVNPLVSANPQRCAVNKADTCAFVQQNLLDEQGQGNGDFPFQLHETVVRDHFGKQMAKVLAHFFKIEVLHAAISRVVKENHYEHDFSL